jgi:hypothetical protein
MQNEGVIEMAKSPKAETTVETTGPTVEAAPSDTAPTPAVFAGPVEAATARPGFMLVDGVEFPVSAVDAPVSDVAAEDAKFIDEGMSSAERVAAYLSTDIQDVLLQQPHAIIDQLLDRLHEKDGMIASHNGDVQAAEQALARAELRVKDIDHINAGLVETNKYLREANDRLVHEIGVLQGDNRDSLGLEKAV